MPRKTKETVKEELIEKNVKKAPKKITKKAQSKVEIKTEKNKISQSKTASVKKSNSKSKAIVKNTSADKKEKAKTTKKSTVSKNAVLPKKTINSSDSKKENTKKVKTAKTAKTKKTSKSTKSIKSKKTSSKVIASENSKIAFSPEYYDLPYRYNQTVVKILAQTPKTLFIYWEISDSDREKLKQTYGQYFFEITKPVLIVYNETLDYSFTVDIDDFANSWYLHVSDSDCKYKIELGRKPIQINYDYIPDYDISKQGPIEPINLSYIYISSSNELESPNDKILFNEIGKIYFRNIKTNQLIERDVSDFPNIYQNGRFINIYEIYSKLYRNEISTNSFNLFNPSSGNLSSGSFSSQFK